MSKEELININGIREDLYQAMQIGDITLNSKHSQELYDFMNYQDKEIERLNNIINELDKYFEEELDRLARETSNIYEDSLGRTKLVNENIYEEVQKIKDKLQELKGNNNENNK